MRGIILALFLGLYGLSAGAEPPDFEQCLPYTGAAWGLCHAGVAVGCDKGGGDQANRRACATIEEKFEDEAGESAPWFPCPCKYFLEPRISAGSWDEPITFLCHENFAGFFEQIGNPPNRISAVNPDTGSAFCEIESPDLSLRWEFESADTFQACKQDVIDYGEMFMRDRNEPEINEPWCGQ